MHLLLWCVLFGVLMSSASPALAINPPANFSAEAGSQRVTLRWTTSPGVTSYNLEQSFNGGGWVHIADPAATDTSYSRINLLNGTAYSYRIDAVSSGVTSVWSNTVTATPQANPNTAPTSAPANFSATGQNSQITLSWSSAPGATRYDLFRRTGSNAYSYLTTVGNLTSYVDAGLTNGVRYDYSITPYNALSGGSYWSYASAAPGPPSSAPANFSAVPGNTQVSLSWSPVFGATSYNLWRKKSTDTTWPVITTINGTSYLDTGLLNGVLYNYSINAVNSNGASTLFSYVDATPAAPSAPVAPTGLVASSPRSSVVNLTWSATAGATSYDVLRSTTSGSNFAVKATVSTNAWSDTTVSNGTLYYYAVVAKNSIGSSGYSNQDSVTPLAAPTGLSAIAGTSSCYLSWNPVVGATSYNVRRQYQPSTGGSPQVNQFSTTATNYRDSFPSQGFISYNYSVQAVNSKATGDFSSIGVYPASVDSDLNTLSLSPVTVQGGTSVTGTVTLTNSPQSGDAVISLSSNNAAAIVPASVTIAGGTTSTTFTVSTTSLTTQQTATITASYAGITKTATLTITVPPAGNRAPVANAQNTSTTKNVVLNGTLTATDVDSSTLTFSKVSDPTHGTVTVASSGAFTYTPATDYVGGDSFTFKANDGSLDSNPAIVSITVNTPANGNRAPIAVNDSVSTPQGVTKDITVLANDSDPDGDPLTLIAVGQATKGTATANPNNTIHYVPLAGATGNDSFSYTISDGHGGQASAIVTVYLSPPAEPGPTPVVTITGTVWACAGGVDNAAHTFDLQITATKSGAAAANSTLTFGFENNLSTDPARKAKVQVAGGAWQETLAVTLNFSGQATVRVLSSDIVAMRDLVVKWNDAEVARKTCSFVVMTGKRGFADPLFPDDPNWQSSDTGLVFNTGDLNRPMIPLLPRFTSSFKTRQAPCRLCRVMFCGLAFSKSVFGTVRKLQIQSN